LSNYFKKIGKVSKDKLKSKRYYHILTENVNKRVCGSTTD